MKISLNLDNKRNLKCIAWQLKITLSVSNIKKFNILKHFQSFLALDLFVTRQDFVTIIFFILYKRQIINFRTIIKIAYNFYSMTET